MIGISKEENGYQICTELGEEITIYNLPEELMHSSCPEGLEELIETLPCPVTLTVLSDTVTAMAFNS